MDFTGKIYHRLLKALLAQDFKFQPFAVFMQTPAPRAIILRHDVDRLPGNALKTARLEHDLGTPASYYFRAVPESWDETIIQKIAGLGHEIGYHYENLSACKGGSARAWEDFQANLAKLRDLAPVTTICMHGSPLSRYDNRDLWQHYDYHDLGIIGEPYFDVDYSRVFYMTDTGRRWDGGRVSVRDKVGGPRNDGKKDKKVRGLEGVKQWPSFHSTFDIIEAVEAGRFPDKVMMTVHPQRWMDDPFQWTKELVLQNVKNVVKRVLISRAKTQSRKG